jgi:hypothetical protein
MVTAGAAYLSNCTVVDDPVQFLTLFFQRVYSADDLRPWC